MPSLLQRASRRRAEELFSALSPAERQHLRYCWSAAARPEQLEPAPRTLGELLWRVWFIMAGRGFGKTRTGAETVRDWEKRTPGCRIALLAQTPDEVRRIMIEGESGLLAVHPERERPLWEASKGLLTWPLRNGQASQAFVYSGANPEELRGPQHHYAWGDEPASWAYGVDAWSNLDFGLRLGEWPRAIVTGTPKPVALVRELVAAKDTVLTKGRTVDNRANLPDTFLRSVLAKYGNSRLARQELDGELLEDTPGALWRRAMFDVEGFRTASRKQLEAIVVAIDPAVTATEGSDLTGIVAAGRVGDVQTGHFYVLADRSQKASPSRWARAAIELYDELEASRIVAEVNNGGDMVSATIHAERSNVLVTQVRASKGKRVRAEPISVLYEQGRVHHVGQLTALEDQLVTWTPEDVEASPDRMDALVWALTELSTSGAAGELPGKTPRSKASGLRAFEM